MTTKSENISIIFNSAAALQDPQKVTGAAYELHRSILESLPIFPVLLRKKERGDFRPDNCIVAMAGERVVGCALLNPVDAPDELYKKIEPKLGADAAQKTSDLCRSFKNAGSVYEIGSICVDPAFRGQGIARRFYQMAAEQAGGNVFAIIVEENFASRAAARHAGYEAAPDSHHAVNFTVKEGQAIPELSGEHVVKVALFRPEQTP